MAVDFDDIHRRYLRDQRGNPRPEIPVRGGDFVTRDGKPYAILRDADGKLVAAYEVRECLFAVKDSALIEALATPEPESEPRDDLMTPTLRGTEKRRP
jgi:hypothetical protein